MTKLEPSSNWRSLEQTIKPKRSSKGERPSKRPRLADDNTRTSVNASHPKLPEVNTFSRGRSSPNAAASTSSKPTVVNGESLPALQQMIRGELAYTEKQKEPGRYVAMDCEMVGVGHEGEESSLARVSVVNFFGYVLLDEIVRQRERVVDYRTQYSGIRPADMAGAMPFDKVQKDVAELLKDRVLVGHAVHNDLKALLLSHPSSMTRDTQVLAYTHKVVKTKRPALRNLVSQEVGATIQTGEHSSVTDARATMAIYRIHRRAWEQAYARISHMKVTAGQKRPAGNVTDSDHVEEDDDEEEQAAGGSQRPKKKSRLATHPGAGRKGVSSGLSVVITESWTKSKKQVRGSGKSTWWKQLS